MEPREKKRSRNGSAEPEVARNLEMECEEKEKGGKGGEKEGVYVQRPGSRGGGEKEGECNAGTTEEEVRTCERRLPAKRCVKTGCMEVAGLDENGSACRDAWEARKGGPETGTGV